MNAHVAKPLDMAKLRQVLCQLVRSDGDAVVVTLMGLFVSVDIVCSSLVMGLTIAGIVSVVYIVIKRADRKKQIAFTPFLLLGYGLTGVFL